MHYGMPSDRERQHDERQHGCSASRERDALFCIFTAVSITLILFGMYSGALAFVWSSYGDDARCCNYAVEALIVDKVHHPKFSGECLLTLEWILGNEAYRQVLDVPLERCQSMDDSGMYIRGCVKEYRPERFVFNDDDDRCKTIVPPNRVRAELRRAWLVTVFFPAIWLALILCLFRTV